MIGILGARIWIESKVDFSNSNNLIVAASAIIIGIADISWTKGQYTFTGIVNATLVAVLGYQILNAVSKIRK
jgi:NCS2 family nucleobase:cation symporter-2